MKNIKGVLQIKDLQRSNNTAINDMKVGIKMESIIAKIDQNNREIILSVRALEKKEENKALKDNELKNEEISKANKSSIGKLIKEELDEG